MSAQISEQIEHVIKQRIVSGLFAGVIVEPTAQYRVTKMRRNMED